MYAIEFTKEARKALLKMPRHASDLVLEKVRGLARDPFSAAHVKKLVGVPGYRLRVGDWRVIYEVKSQRLVVHVLRIGARGGVYE